MYQHNDFVRPVNILVVDDFEPFRRVVVSQLERRAEFRIVGQVSDGLEAVRRVRELQPDLVVLDIRLPSLNGFEVASRILQLCPNSKIIFFSVETCRELVQEAFRMGAHGYVFKADATELTRALDTVLEGKQYLSRELRSNAMRDAEKSVDDWLLPLDSQKDRTSRVHEMMCYPSDAALVDGFARHVGAALSVANAVVVIATESHQAAILQRLKADGVDVSAAIKRGSYIPLEAVETLSRIMVNGLPDPTRCCNVFGDHVTRAAKSAKSKRPKVEICGEGTSTLLAAGNTEAAIRLEHLWDETMRSYHHLETLCGFLPSAFRGNESGSILQRISAEHSVVYSL
jgi:DNA-binding NarL/FixJ family response regulator